MQKLDFSKLLGFETVARELGRSVDFQEATVGDKLGAKIGAPEVTSPADAIDFLDETLGAKLGAKVGDVEAN